MTSIQSGDLNYLRIDGNITIDGNQNSQLFMAGGLSGKDISFSIVNHYDIVMSVFDPLAPGGNDFVTLKNQYRPSATGDNFSVSGIKFENGTIWNAISPNKDMTHPGALFVQKEVLEIGSNRYIYAPAKVAADIVSNGGNATVEGDGLLNIVGTYNFLKINEINNDYNRIYCQITNYGEIRETGYYTYSNVTLTGSRAILNVTDAKVNVLGDGGNLYTSGYGNIIANGTFRDMVVDSHDYNNLNVTLNGSGLIKNSLGWNGVTLSDSASNLTADNSAVTVTAAQGSITLNNGASCQLKGGSTNGQNVFVNANGKGLSYQADTNTNVTVNLTSGIAIETYGLGYTTNIVDISGSGTLDVSNFTSASGRIIATNFSDIAKFHIDSSGSDSIISYDGSDAFIKLHNVSPDELSLSTPALDTNVGARAVSLVLTPQDHSIPLLSGSNLFPVAS